MKRDIVPITTYSRQPLTSTLKQEHKLRLQRVITVWKGAFCRAAHRISSNSCNLPIPPDSAFYCILALGTKIDNMWNYGKTGVYDLYYQGNMLLWTQKHKLTIFYLFVCFFTKTKLNLKVIWHTQSGVSFRFHYDKLHSDDTGIHFLETCCPWVFFATVISCQILMITAAQQMGVFFQKWSEKGINIWLCMLKRTVYWRTSGSSELTACMLSPAHPSSP